MASELPIVEKNVSSNNKRRAEKPVRIAYVVNTFGMGGLERCIANLVNELDRERFQPTIICLSRIGDAQEWVKATDIEILELKKKAGNDPGVVWKLARTLRHKRIELVHSHNWGTLVETAIARRWARVEFHVHAEHGLELVDLRVRRWRFKARRAAMRWALKRTDATVVVDESVCEKLAERSGISTDKFVVVPNGISLERTQDSQGRGRELRETLKVADDDVLLGSVGRLAAVKDYALAIDTVVVLRKRGIPAHLVLVGDGPKREHLVSHSDECGVAEFVHIVGQQQDVAVWYAAMDLYLNTSVSEGMNLAIMEAMANCLPSVVVDVGGNRQLVRGYDDCGVVVRDRHASVLADAVEMLLSDSALKQEMKKSASSVYQCNFSSATMTERYMDLYTNLRDHNRVEIEATCLA